MRTNFATDGVRAVHLDETIWTTFGRLVHWDDCAIGQHVPISCMGDVCCCVNAVWVLLQNK